jgi:hypothetical protein
MLFCFRFGEFMLDWLKLEIIPLHGFECGDLVDRGRGRK